MSYLVKHILQHIIYHSFDCVRPLLGLALHLRNLFPHLGRKVPRGFPLVATVAAGLVGFTSEASRVSGKVFCAFTVGAEPFGALAQRLQVGILTLYPLFLMLVRIVPSKTAFLTLGQRPITRMVSCLWRRGNALRALALKTFPIPGKVVKVALGALPIFRFEIGGISLYNS